MYLTTNYFELFELPSSFDIDQDCLIQRYRELQKVVHPDKYTQASDRERRLAIQNSTYINEAFQTLKDPLLRGQYLLRLRYPTDEQPEAAMTGEFLMAQMTLREELAEIKQQAQPLDALNLFTRGVESRIQQLITALSQQFMTQDFPAARESIYQLQFFKRLYEEAVALEENLIE
jgi:molecular chaperone HscB